MPCSTIPFAFSGCPTLLTLAALACSLATVTSEWRVTESWSSCRPNRELMEKKVVLRSKVRDRGALLLKVRCDMGLDPSSSVCGFCVTTLRAINVGAIHLWG